MILSPENTYVPKDAYVPKPESAEIPMRPPPAEKSVEDKAFHLAQKNVIDLSFRVDINHIQADTLSHPPITYLEALEALSRGQRHSHCQ